MSELRYDYGLLIAEGKVKGKKVIHKFGKNPAVGTGAFEAIWNGGATYTGFNPTAAETVSIVSSSANDSSAGTGLRTIRLFGLDANYNEITEDIVLNGITPVLSTLSYIRLNTAKGLTAGTTTWNEGNITVRQSITTANIFAVIPATYNTTMIAAYTIPANKKGYIISQASAIANKNAATVDIRLKIRQPGNIFVVEGEAAINSQGTGFIERKFKVPAQIPAKTDFFIEAEASSSVAVSAFLDILLVDE